MANNEQEKIIISVSADTKDASKNIDNLKGKLDSVNNTQLDRPFKSFKQEIKEATLEAKKMEDQFGRNSTEFATAAKRVAELKDRFGEFNQSIGAFNPDNKLQAFVTIAKGAISTIAGVTGAMQFLGVESGTATEAIAKLQGLMAFSEMLNSLDDIKNSFSNLGQVIQSSSAYQAVNNQLTSAATGIMKLFGVSVEGSTTALRALKTVLAVSIIGAVIAGIAALVEHFDDLKEALGFTSKAQEQFNKTIEDYNKGAATAAQKISEVRVGFQLAEQGVISKKEALQKYNDTLGDALGKAKSLDEAERLVAKGADAYIKITGLKAQANALYALSAQESAKALTASQEDQTDWMDKTKAWLANYISIGSGTAIAIEAQQKGAEEAASKANKSAELYQKKAEELLKSAAELGKESGVKANVLDNKDTSKEDEERRKRAAELLKKEREDLKKHLEELQKIQTDADRSRNEAVMNEREKELADIDNHYADQEKIVHRNEEEQVKILKDELKRKAITQKQYNDQFLAMQRAVGDTVLALMNEQDTKKIEVEKKYNKIIADFIDGYQETAYQKSRKKLIEDFDEKIKVADEKQKELLEKLKDSELNKLDTAETLRKNVVTTQTNVIKTERDNKEQPNDSVEKILQKQQEIAKARIEAENADYEQRKQAAQGNAEELEKIEEEHQTNLLNIQQAYNDKAIELRNQLFQNAFSNVTDGAQSLRDAEDVDFQAQYDALAGNQEAQEELTKKHEKRLRDIEKIESMARLAIASAEALAKKDYYQAASNALMLASTAAGKATGVGKALAIAATTIDTIRAAMAAFTGMTQAIPGPYGIAAGIVAAAAATALGVANVKKIVSVKVPGGDGAASSTPTPTFTAPQIESTALNPDANAIKDVRVTNQQDQPIKAYITDRDLQDHQDKQQFYNNLGNV
ncbi:MAG: hypothetical protein QM737_22630 [Ferruginibacter sp.]